jgi:hypothetical protein
MPAASLSIKLRCASWQQLATIYSRDLSRGSMFLKASTQPPLGTIVRIDLELPSATVIEISGAIAKHVVDPQRGAGVELKLEPLPTQSVWLIESALAAEKKVRATSAGVAESEGATEEPAAPARASTLSDGSDVAEAETELVSALEAEAESLRKLNPFLVLGLGYETTDADVRAAFGELTKRYHPDRFARYQSPRLRQVAAEIFILIRDAYRRLADANSRKQVVASLGPKTPTRAQTPHGSTTSARVEVAGAPASPAAARAAIPVIAQVTPPGTPDRRPDSPTTPGAYDAPTSPSGKTAELASTELARHEHLAIPIAPAAPKTTARTASSGQPARQPAAQAKLGAAVTTPPPISVAADTDTEGLEQLIEGNRIDEALAGYRVLAKRQPNERAYRAGIELCEGLRALAQRDRLEAAQRFEAALELDPSNERAARELADMRRQATNERKGLLSRLMGKKEPPP